MAVSVFDLFKIGIGPSSSHTVGPMRAARLFALRLAHDGAARSDARACRAQLYGSLGATGKGHGSDKAVLLGLAGDEPDTVDVDAIPARSQAIARSDVAAPARHARDRLRREDRPHLPPPRDAALPRQRHALHGLRRGGGELATRAVLLGRRRLRRQRRGRRPTAALQKVIAPDTTVLPLPVPQRRRAARADAARTAAAIAELMRRNERHWRSDAEIDAGLLKIWARDAGLRRARLHDRRHAARRLQGAAPRRRPAPRSCARNPEAALRDPLQVLDWVNLYALAVNEENAAGGRVVTAPTNGAAGIVPAVLHYYTRFVPGANDDGVIDFLLTAGGDRHALQGERLDLRRRGRLPGRGRRGLLDGRRGARARCSAARRRRSRTPPRSAWSTTSA